MAGGRHFRQTTADGLHAPISWTYANTTDRDNHTPASGPPDVLTVADNFKVCFVINQGAFYYLADYSVPTWLPWSGSASNDAGAIVSGDGEFTVLAGVVVGDLVYASGTDAMAVADNSALSTTPVIGIVKAKPSSITATIIYTGKVTGLSGFTAGADLFLGTSGGIVDATGLPSATGSVVQKIGNALNATSLFLRPGTVVVL